MKDELQTFSHSFKDTLNNIWSGCIKYYNSIFINQGTAKIEEKQAQDLSQNLNTSLLPAIDLSDLSMLGLYQNNLEPKALKDINKIIGPESTYLYITRQAIYIFLQHLIELGSGYISKEAIISFNQLVINDNSFIGLPLIYTFDVCLKRPAIGVLNFVFGHTIHGNKNDFELTNLVKIKIFNQEFLSLYLKENASNEYQSLESNIISTLSYYSSNLAMFFTTLIIVPKICNGYIFFSKQGSDIKKSLAINFVLKITSLAAGYLTNKAIATTMEKDSYKKFGSFINIHSDHFQLKETMFVAGTKHLNNREVLNDKLALKLQEEQIPLNALNSLVNIDALQQLSSIYYSIKSSTHIPLNERFANIEEFKRINGLVNSYLNDLSACFVLSRDSEFRMKQINKIAEEMYNYTKNNINNSKIYQNNNSSKLIISNLKVDIIAKNQTIIDFSGSELSIEIAPGKHYLMEGQNSVGKSLLLKLIIGYSSGLNLSGILSYPQNLAKSDIGYVFQDDYFGTLKPLLHRLSNPKLLPADITTTNSILKDSTILTKEELEHLVDFTGELLFKMKYQPEWKNSEEAKQALLKNYSNYENFMNTGDQDEWKKLADSYSNLTGGQKKKLAIANAIYNQAKLVILDEAFNAVDQETKLIIYKLINQYLPHATVIAIQHQVGDHLIEEKQAQEIDTAASAIIKQIYDISKSSNNAQINDLVKQLIKPQNNDTSNSEEMLFFHQIITMKSNQTESGEISTFFEITNLHDSNDTLIEFNNHNPSSSELLCNNSETLEIEVLGNI